MVTRPPPSPWLGRRALELAILYYRRRLSGRGPLRRVTCTFDRCESCSAYGLRVVRHHARGLLHAMRLILGRIRRCRTSSVHRHHDALLWGEDYDRLETVDEAAVAVHERVGTRRALLRAAIGLARYRRERKILLRLLDRLRALPRAVDPREVLPLRDGRRLPEHVRTRWQRQLLIPGLLVMLAPWLPTVATVGTVTLALALTMTSTGRFLSERRRIDRQTRLGRFAAG